jgi:hypothetical protein
MNFVTPAGRRGLIELAVDVAPLGQSTFAAAHLQHAGLEPYGDRFGTTQSIYLQNAI